MTFINFPKVISLFAAALIMSSPLAAQESELEKAGLDTSEKMSAYYTKAIEDVLKQTDLFMPFDSGSLRSARRVVRKMGLAQTEKRIIERSKTHYEKWEGKLTLGSLGTGTVEVELSGCSEGSRKLYRYGFRVWGLDASEMASFEALSRQYVNAYPDFRGRIMHNATRERFATGIEPEVGTMITITTVLDLEKSESSKVGQFRGDMIMKCR